MMVKRLDILLTPVLLSGIKEIGVGVGVCLAGLPRSLRFQDFCEPSSLSGAGKDKPARQIKAR